MLKTIISSQDISGDLDSPSIWDRQRAIVRFIYAKYGRFIRTQVYHRINFNSSVKFHSPRYFIRFNEHLDEIADRSIALVYNSVKIQFAEQIMKNIAESLAFNLVRNEKMLTIHAVDNKLMENLIREYFSDVIFSHRDNDDFVDALMILLDTTTSATNIAVLNGIAHKPSEDLFGKL